jgi:hypothetical protein
MNKENKKSDIVILVISILGLIAVAIDITRNALYTYLNIKLY